MSKIQHILFFFGNFIKGAYPDQFNLSLVDEKYISLFKMFSSWVNISVQYSPTGLETLLNMLIIRKGNFIRSQPGKAVRVLTVQISLGISASFTDRHRPSITGQCSVTALGLRLYSLPSANETNPLVCAMVQTDLILLCCDYL